jgi:HEPN domain-containing protein
MDKQEITAYWIEIADSDLSTAENLFNSGDYHWCLFMLHLVIEKLLKAYYTKHIGMNVPRTHDLLRLATLCGLEPDDNKKNALDRMTNFNLAARYPDYKKEFYKIATKDFAREQMSVASEMKLWIMEIL